MNLADYVQRLSDLTGQPNRGSEGRKRLIRQLNYALKQIWDDVPLVLLSEEHRIRLEPPVDGLTVKSNDDPLVFEITAGAVPGGTVTLDRHLRRGRWVEFYYEGQYHYRRVRDVWTVGQEVLVYWFSIDRPWNGTPDESMPARMFTREYPYPHDVAKIHKVFFSPEKEPSRVIVPMTREEIDHFSWSQGWRNIRDPSSYGRGDFFQLPAPHYTPEVALRANAIEEGNTDQWGFSPDNGLEHGSLDGNMPWYGAAGEFSYRVCHVFGRLPFSDNFINNEQDHPRRPFYISAPSPPSARISTEWGQQAIVVTTPDIDYLDGFGRDNTTESFHHGGYEKWYFRARHETEKALVTSAKYPSVEADGAYYLWAIDDGFNVTIYDHGHLDPVSKQFPLKDMFGHYHLRLDALPPRDGFLTMQITRRPMEMVYDSQVPNIPAELEKLLIDLSCAYVLGKQDGAPDRESFYYMNYLRSVDDMRKELAQPGHDIARFGDGLSVGSVVGVQWGGVGEI